MVKVNQPDRAGRSDGGWLDRRGGDPRQESRDADGNRHITKGASSGHFQSDPQRASKTLPPTRWKPS